MNDLEKQLSVVWDACTKPSNADVMIVENGVWKTLNAPQYQLPPILKINQHVKAKHD
jgi:hypothetical protein